MQPNRPVESGALKQADAAPSSISVGEARLSDDEHRQLVRWVYKNYRPLIVSQLQEGGECLSDENIKLFAETLVNDDVTNGLPVFGRVVGVYRRVENYPETLKEIQQTQAELITPMGSQLAREANQLADASQSLMAQREQQSQDIFLELSLRHYNDTDKPSAVIANSKYVVAFASIAGNERLNQMGVFDNPVQLLIDAASEGHAGACYELARRYTARNVPEEPLQSVDMIQIVNHVLEQEDQEVFDTAFYTQTPYLAPLRSLIGVVTAAQNGEPPFQNRRQGLRECQQEVEDSGSAVRSDMVS